MNNIKNFSEYIVEMKSEREIVRDLARHLSVDKDVIKYLNMSRHQRKIGWRELLDIKLIGKQKNYINYITKNMVADYNPQITGYINIDDNEGDDFDNKSISKKSSAYDDAFISDIEDRLEDIEDVLGIDPENEDSIDMVDNALKDAGYVKPEIEDEDEEDDIDEEE